MTNSKGNKDIRAFVKKRFFSFAGRGVLWSLLALFTQYSQAQDFEGGVFGGVSYYLGDLNPGKHFQKVKPAYGVMLRYNFDSRWAVKFSGNMGKVEGAASGSAFLPGRELTFTSNITDLSLVGEFNFFNYFTGSKKSSFTPYIFGGVSVFFFNPKSGGQSLRELGTEGQNIAYLGRAPYSTIGLSVPFGFGFKLSLTNRLGITAFWQMHKTFTDYLDDVSTTYYLDGRSIDPEDPYQYYSDPSMDHTTGMQRGNSRTNDWYSFTGVTVAYRFKLGEKRRCRDLEH